MIRYSMPVNKSRKHYSESTWEVPIPMLCLSCVTCNDFGWVPGPCVRSAPLCSTLRLRHPRSKSIFVRCRGSGREMELESEEWRVESGGGKLSSPAHWPGGDLESCRAPHHWLISWAATQCQEAVAAPVTQRYVKNCPLASAAQPILPHFLLHLARNKHLKKCQ